MGATQLSERFGDATHLHALKGIMIGSVQSAPRSFFQARTHQARTIKSAIDYFNDRHEAAQIIMPCGSGKTYVSSRIMLAVPVPTGQRSRLTLFVAPLRRLASQTYEAQRKVLLDERYRNPVGALRADIVVCASDLGTGSLGIRRIDQSDLPAWFKNATDDLALRGSGDAYLHSLITTYQSCPGVLRHARECGVTFDLVVADEAHYAAGVRFVMCDDAQVDDKPFSAVHKSPARHRLYLTATPRIFPGNETMTGDRWNEDIRSGLLTYEREDSEASSLLEAFERVNLNDEVSIGDRSANANAAHRVLLMLRAQALLVGSRSTAY